MTKSIKQVKVKDGEYKATWSGFVVTIMRPKLTDSEFKPSMLNDYCAIKNDGLALDVEVNKGIKGIGIRKKVEVIDGWVYVDLSVEDRRELKLKKILE
jgi:hypothetical protein